MGTQDRYETAALTAFLGTHSVWQRSWVPNIPHWARMLVVAPVVRTIFRPSRPAGNQLPGPVGA